jgi:predicted dehydrogenase
MRIAVVGVGYLGEHHARILSDLDGVELVGVVDINRERSIEIASRFGTEAFTDYRDILDRVDALSIVTPTTSHHGIALDALRSGKDLFIEKPITTTLEEADELIDEADRRGCILQVGHIERYNPAVSYLYGIIESPFFFESERLSPYCARGTDVDVTIDLMIHDIDIILDMAGSEVRSLRAEGISVMSSGIDEARVWIDFENGISASLIASRICREKERALRVFEETPRGQRFIDVNYKDSELRVISEGSEEIVKPEYREPLREELIDFVRAVITRDPPKVTGLQARKALKIALDINSVIRKGW